MSSGRQLPFLPGIASPTVQTPFVTDRSCTSYSEQFRGHFLKQRPTNHSVEHHAAARRNHALSHAENPNAHYATSTSQITSPDRLVALRGAQPPEPFPLEPKDRRMRTSQFAFRTTNEEMFSTVLSQTAAKQPRATRRRGTLSLGLEHPAERDEPPHFRSTKQVQDAQTQSSLRELSSKGASARQQPFSFQDEIQVDHSHLGIGNVANQTATRTAAKPIVDHWKQPVSQRAELTSPSRGGGLPSINLAYKDQRLAEDDDLLCRKCKYRRQHAHSVMDTQHRRTTPSPAYMQSTYQATMHDPRAHSSLC